MLESLIVFLILLWVILYLIVHIGGSFVHLILFIALIALAFRIFRKTPPTI